VLVDRDRDGAKPRARSVRFADFAEELEGDGGGGEGEGGGEDRGSGGEGAGPAAPGQRPPNAGGSARRARRAAELAARDPRLVGGVQPTREERAAAARGVARDYSRAKALPPGEWARLKAESRTAPILCKIGRRGATPQLAEAVANAWRTREVVKLRVHDERSARNAVMPQLNIVLKQLEEVTGGVLVEAIGTSIWLYRRGAGRVASTGFARALACRSEATACSADCLVLRLTPPPPARSPDPLRPARGKNYVPPPKPVHVELRKQAQKAELIPPGLEAAGAKPAPRRGAPER
jgi:RNA-binding protein YhbY